MQVEIINIGDELLIGQVINSNAAKMGQMLINGGFSTRRMITISDDKADILASIDNRLPDTKIIIFSGGLGPTRDDLTKNTLAEYFNTELVLNQDAYNDLVKYFDSRNLKLTPTNEEQAYQPKDCISLPNEVGTARGMWFEKDDLVVISLPGVPYEMIHIMETQVMPRLIKKYNTEPLNYRTVMTIGIGESFLSDKISQWEDALPSDMSLAYLPKFGTVRLRLSCADTNAKRSIERINAEIEKLEPIISEYIYGYDEISLEEVIGQKLKEKGKTLSTAESCTGGYVSHLITSIAGSSAYYKGSIISYSNEVKANNLNIPTEIIEKHGAVSEEVVALMAENVKKALNTDYSIAISGIAGPDGGTEDKPTGTVWITASSPLRIETKKFNLNGNRMQNIERSALMALNMLRILLNE